MKNNRLDSTQSQFKCSSLESRKSDEKTPTGTDTSKEWPSSAGTDRVRSSQSMLSMLRTEVDMLSLKSTSMVSPGECNSSISFSFCASVSGSSAPSRRVSSRESEVTHAGGFATWTKGGGRDKAVLMGRVVTLAVTTRSLSRLGGSCVM